MKTKKKPAAKKRTPSLSSEVESISGTESVGRIRDKVLEELFQDTEQDGRSRNVTKRTKKRGGSGSLGSHLSPPPKRAKRIMPESTSEDEAPPVVKDRKRKKAKKIISESSSEEEATPVAKEKKKKRKKKAAKIASSSSSSSEASTGSSSDSEEVDHWSMLQEVWAVENRPAMFRKKKVVRKMAWRELMEFRKEYLEECKASGKGGALFGADPALPVTKFKAGKDDRTGRIHPASLLRLPVVEPEEFWKLVPLRREPIFRSVPLQHCGGTVIVNELAIIRMHDR